MSSIGVRKYEIIYFGDRWDYMWRRRQQFAYRFAMMPEVGRVVYVELPLSLTSLLKFIVGKSDGDAALRWRRVFKKGLRSNMDGVEVVTPISILPPFRSSVLFRLNDRLLGWFTRLLVRCGLAGKKYGEGGCILWLSHPFGGDFIGKFAESFKCYDCTEKFVQYEDFDPGFLNEVKRRDMEMTVKADIVFTQTKLYCEEKRKINPNTHLLPNAVSSNTISKNGGEADLGMLGITTRPVLGFVGNLNKRTDYELLSDLAVRHKEWSLVLIGVVDDAKLTEGLRKLLNVRFLGPMPYRRIQSIIRSFDVCLIPYRKLSLLGSPIKLFDYLASGKPIVSTRFSGVEDFADLVYIADDIEGFSKKVEEALSEPPTKAEQRLAKVKENSWDVRAKEAWGLITDKL